MTVAKPISTLAAIGAVGALLCAPAASLASAGAANAGTAGKTPTAAERKLLQSPQLWATIDVCSPANQLDTVGIRKLELERFDFDPYIAFARIT